MTDQAFQFLSNLKPFSFLPESEVRRIADNISEKNYPKNTILSVQGKSTVDHIFVIKHGSLELYYEAEGKKIQPGFLKPGEVCGAIATLMNSATAVRTVRVNQDSSFYTIPREIFAEVCNRSEIFRDFFVKIYGKFMRDESYASIIATGQASHFLSGVVPFSFLHEEDLEKIASHLSVVHYPKNTVMLVQGQSEVEHLYILQKGAVERYYEEKSGKKKLRGVLYEGDIYGGISMLINNSISVRTLRTIEKSYFYTLPKNFFWIFATSMKPFPNISLTRSANR